MHSVMMHKDIDGFVKVVKGGTTEDFKYSENGRDMTFDQMVDGMKQGFAMLSKVVSADSKLLTLEEHGDSATSTTRHSMLGITQDGKHKMGFTGTSVETYRKENGKWLMASMAWKSEQMTMDGKPMSPEQMGGQ